MKTLTSELTVFLKDADLMATTAFLTLTGKMGYADILFGLKRFDYYRFTLGIGEGEEPERIIDSLSQVLSSQSTFYNRNKHYYHLASSCDGTCITRGTDLEVAQRKLELEVSKFLTSKEGRKLHVQSGSEMITFNGETLFLAKLLVQEREHAGKKALSNKLRSELSGRATDFTHRGVMWWLVLGSPGRTEAEQLIEEIAVSVTRKKGLLVNPNYQSYELTAISELDLGNV